MVFFDIELFQAWSRIAYDPCSQRTKIAINYGGSHDWRAGPNGSSAMILLSHNKEFSMQRTLRLRLAFCGLRACPSTPCIRPNCTPTLEREHEIQFKLICGATSYITFPHNMWIETTHLTFGRLTHSLVIESHDWRSSVFNLLIVIRFEYLWVSRYHFLQTHMSKSRSVYCVQTWTESFLDSYMSDFFAQHLWLVDHSNTNEG